MAVRAQRVSASLVAAASLVVLPPGQARAQEAPRAPDARPWFVSAAKWVKWPTLAAAVGFTAVAITRKDDADGYYAELRGLCAEQPDECTIGTTGAYVNAQAEALYQQTLRLDRQARTWMIGGQGFLFVSGALFLIDLVAGSDRPENIPYTPLEAYAAPGTLGVRWRF